MSSRHVVLLSAHSPPCALTLAIGGREGVDAGSLAPMWLARCAAVGGNDKEREKEREKENKLGTLLWARLSSFTVGPLQPPTPPPLPPPSRFPPAMSPFPVC